MFSHWYKKVPEEDLHKYGVIKPKDVYISETLVEVEDMVENQGKMHLLILL